MKQEAFRTIRLALPIIVGNLAQIALGTLDSAMVGAIDYKQLAAGSLVINMLGIPYVICIGMTMSVSPIVAAANGQHDHKKVSHFLYNGFILCSLIAVLVALLVEFGSPLVFHIGQDPEVARLAYPYLRIMGWSTIPMIMFLALIQFADGLEHTEVAMILSLVTLPVNAFLNWLLIYGNWGFPRMEIVGAGVGTLVTRTLVLLILVSVIVFHRHFKKYVLVRRSTWQVTWKSLGALLRIGIPSSMQYGMEAGAFAISGLMVGTIGATEQAAHQIALNTAATAFMVSLGLSQGGAIRVSNAWGRSDLSGVRRIGLSTLFTALIYGGICAVCFIAFRHLLPYAFTDNLPVVQLASGLMLLAAFFQISDSVQATCVGLLRGIRDVNIPTAFVAVAYWVIGIPCGYFLAFHAGWGAYGIWTGFVIGLTLSAVLLTGRFITLSRKIRKSS